MSNKGFSHLGLSTLDMDKTRAFYENVMGFKAVRCDLIPVKEGGRIRHVFFDTGRDQLMAFMEARRGRDSRRVRYIDLARTRRAAGVLPFCFRGGQRSGIGAEA